LSDLDELQQRLLELYQKLRAELHEKWRRDLPGYELPFDRWERARNLGFGEGSSIYQGSYVYGDVAVGRHTWIGPFTLLDGSGGLTIGDYCSISAGVQIYTHDSVRWALSGGKAEYDRSPVAIGNCCYVGPQAVIAKGVVVGDHCVIGANSFVNRGIAPFTIAYGTPCRPAGRVHVSDTGYITLEFDDN
jgi:acetyltransferase-like isoleucine patch superfamily enzyme